MDTDTFNIKIDISIGDISRLSYSEKIYDSSISDSNNRSEYFFPTTTNLTNQFVTASD
jgi:hypothetical protein